MNNIFYGWATGYGRLYDDNVDEHDAEVKPKHVAAEIGKLLARRRRTASSRSEA